MFVHYKFVLFIITIFSFFINSDATYGTVQVWTTDRDQNCRNSLSVSLPEFDRMQGKKKKQVIKLLINANYSQKR